MSARDMQRELIEMAVWTDALIAITVMGSLIVAALMGGGS